MERTRYTKDDYYEFMRRVMSGRLRSSVSRDADMPHYTHILWYIERDAEFAALWKAHVKDVPISERVRRGRLEAKNKRQEAA